METQLIMAENKKFILGQYFTKKEIVKRVLDLLQNYKNYPLSSSILEPSSGTRNFVKELEKRGFENISECEIDETLTETPKDFFGLERNEKFDLIIGNPPFTKYNVKESYFYPSNYKNNFFLGKELQKKEKIQIKYKFFFLCVLLHLHFFIKIRSLLDCLLSETAFPFLSSKCFTLLKKPKQLLFFKNDSN